MLRAFTIVFFLIIFSFSAKSQNQLSNNLGFGGFANYNLISHSSDFRKLPTIPNCCPKFDNGSGTGLGFGLFYKLPVDRNFLFRINIAYAPMNGLFTSTEETFVSFNNESVPGEFEHQLDVSMSSLNIEPMISYYLINDFKINLGFGLGMLLNKSYSQKEQITSPEYVGTFLDEDGNDTYKRVRNEYSGDLPDASGIIPYISAGISYAFPLNSDGSLSIEPEAFYTLNLAPPVNNLDWTTSSIKFGFSIHFNSVANRKQNRSRPKEQMPDLDKSSELELAIDSDDIIYDEFDYDKKQKSQAAEKTTLNASVKAVAVDHGTEYQKARLVIEEFLSTNMRPLLNYIFFDNNSDIIPERYNLLEKDKVDEFKMSDFANVPTLATYYEILNIIGKRMELRPESKLTLVGNNSNTGNERANKKLSEKRVFRVKEYLQNIWGIDESRIAIRIRNLPENASNSNNDDGIEENRRVEILSDDWEIIKPVITNDTLRKAHPSIRFYLDAETANGVKEWKLSISQNDIVLKEFSGQGNLPEFRDWNVDKEKETMPLYSDHLDFVLKVKDSTGKSIYSEVGVLELEQITIKKKMINRIQDKRVDRYSLILYDFASSELSTNNMKIVDIIKANLDTDSRILVNGHTDRIGDEDYNATLSEKRADYLSKKFTEHKAYKFGSGESELLYDNELPEGRFYCRTVVVEVETPLKW
jgi:outer membrane protein OmpA-like peptidoglycan-associated protein